MGSVGRFMMEGVASEGFGRLRPTSRGMKQSSLVRKGCTSALAFTVMLFPPASGDCDGQTRSFAVICGAFCSPHIATLRRNRGDGTGADASS